MRYFLMRKDEALIILDMSANGGIERYSREGLDNPQLPLQYRSNKNEWLSKWWMERSIPIGQGRVDQMLIEKGLLGPGEYLMKNLGLSLTDYYWIKPLESDFKWKDVNLYQNDFKENILVEIDNSFKSFTPNSSLQGQLEKSWQIRNGKRVLIKGNRDEYSCESMNEVFASLLHKKQGYDNYIPYSLLKIKNRRYDYGCKSELFTDLDHELVSAWAIITSKKKPSHLNSYEHFIEVCGEHGIDTIQLRRDLEYQIMTDYILSNRDRHMNNISVLRDAKTLKFIRMAPIYDTGKSMFVRRDLPMRYAELTDYEVNSFVKKETKLLGYVTDKNLVDVKKLPSADELFKLYTKDSRLSDARRNLVCEAYETKIKAFIAWQNA